MFRSRLMLALLVIAALILAASGYIAWQAIQRQRLFYTDGDAIHQSVRHINPRDILWRPPVALSANINTDDDERRVCIGSDEQTIIFTRQRPGQDRDIYIAQRERSVEGNPDVQNEWGAHGWSDPLPLRDINSLDNDQDPAISRDRSLLIFSSDRPGGLGGFDLWAAHRTPTGWGEPVNLGPQVNSEFDEVTPALSPNALQLFFASNRPSVDSTHDTKSPTTQNAQAAPQSAEAKPSFNLFAAEIMNGAPQSPNPIAELNSDFDDIAPALSPSGDFVYFSSKRQGGFGGADLYRARILDGKILQPVNLGPDVNTARDESDPSLCMGGFGLFFSSDRITESELSPLSGANLFFTTSREVFVQADQSPAVDWAALERFLGPALLLLLLAALLATLLLAMMRGVRTRRLSLIARCLLVSLIAHLMLLMMLTFWHVTVQMAEKLDRGGTRVVLTSHAAGDELNQQVRGEFTEQKVTATPLSSEMAQSEIAVEFEQSLAALPVQQSEAEAPEPMRLRTQPAEADTPPASDAPLRIAKIAQPETLAIRSTMPESQIAQGEPVLVESSPNLQSLTIAQAAGAPPKVEPPPQQAVAMTPTQQNASELREQPQQIVANPQSSAAPAEATSPAEIAVKLPTISATQSDSIAIDVANLPAPSNQKIESSSEPQVQLASAAVTSTRSETTPAPDAANVPPTSFEPAQTTADQAQQPIAIANSAADSTPVTSSSNQLAQAAPNLTVPSTPLPGGIAAAGPADFANVETAYETAMLKGPQMLTSDVAAAEHRSTSIKAEAPAATAHEFVPHPVDVTAEQVASSFGDVDAPIGTEMANSSIVQPALAMAAVQMINNVPVQTPEGEDAAPMSVELMVASPKSLIADATRQAGVVDNVMKESAAAGARLAPEESDAHSADVAHADPVPLAMVAAASTPHDNASLPSVVSKSASDLPQLTDIATATPTESAPPSDQFAQRAPEFREQLVKRMGGSEETEKAVALALQWLANHQSSNGRWAAKDFDDRCGACGGAAKFDTDIATTGLALLCFLAADHTHTKTGPYRQNVERAINWLISRQKRDGDLRNGETMYSHGIASIALAEAFAMTRDERLRQPVQSATQFIIEAKNQAVGGWRYEPGQAGDTSVLGWQIMALCSARRAGIQIPAEMFEMTARWLDSVSTESRRGLYAYQPGQRHSPSMTAEAMFVQQLLGLKPDEPRMLASSQYIMDNMPRWRGDASTYYWYYATLAMFQQQGPSWNAWNTALTEQLLAHQRTEGTAAGSWDVKDNWSRIGGRVYQTALCTLCLEVYYRYLPMYASVQQKE